MQIRYLVLLALIFAHGCAKSEVIAPPDTHVEQQWQLRWSDEFDSSAIDRAAWTPLESGPYNNFLNYFLPEQGFVRDSTLVIRSESRKYESWSYVSGDYRTSSSWKYGRFEVRAKASGSKGIWPAIWMTTDAHWPPEIDIMELLGDAPKIVHMTNHWRAADQSLQQKSTVFNGPDFTLDYHVYAVEWDSLEIRWYIDSVKRFNTNLGVPHEPLQIRLSAGVGSSWFPWGGPPDSSTKFPADFLIDYVRVYQK